jgi:5'-3' exonuclease
MMKTPQISFNETSLIDSVIAKIDEYIRLITPHNCVYIAFDGVAPVAKMRQQRTRRYKSLYMASLIPTESSQPHATGGGISAWNTSAITPGTPFMNRLSSTIKQSFHNSESKYGVKQLIVSAADVAGEGEHKMFKHIRDNAAPIDNVAVYGLDADLIMLSIFHYHLCKNIYVFRETPEFIKSKVIHSADSDTLFMDISGLSQSILQEMGCKHRDTNQIYDYAFMCFMLGNDFLPHFPSLNIRTHGIQVLLDTYRETVGNIVDARFISNTTGNIQWNWFGKFVQALAENEHELLLQEHRSRDKFDNYAWKVDDREKLIHNAAIICRGTEKYICPTEEGWQSRYYRALLDVNSREKQVPKICKNYLEGLEWVFRYYTDSCVHWKWSYQYNYPPLLSDLVQCIPTREKTLIKKSLGSNTAVSPKTQLAYVLPPSLHNELLGEPVAEYLKTHYNHYYDVAPQYKWTYCRYFWESHLHMRETPIEILEKWDSMPLFR